MSNKIWIESHLQGSGYSFRWKKICLKKIGLVHAKITGYFFSFVANADQSGCGGILHGKQGNITAPLDNNGKYRNGIQCTWDIGKSKMPLKSRIGSC